MSESERHRHFSGSAGLQDQPCFFRDGRNAELNPPVRSRGPSGEVSVDIQNVWDVGARLGFGKAAIFRSIRLCCWRLFQTSRSQLCRYSSTTETVSFLGCPQFYSLTQERNCDVV